MQHKQLFVKEKKKKKEKCVYKQLNRIQNIPVMGLYNPILNAELYRIIGRDLRRALVQPSSQNKNSGRSGLDPCRCSKTQRIDCTTALGNLFHSLTVLVVEFFP